MNKEYLKELRDLHYFMGTIVSKGSKITCTWGSNRGCIYELMKLSTGRWAFHDPADTHPDTTLAGSHMSKEEAIRATFNHPSIAVYIDGQVVTKDNFNLFSSHLNES